MSRYGKLCTEFYDLDKPQAPPDALKFYTRYATDSIGPILEPMCGSGRFLAPLLENGFKIDGVDSSAFMLQACRVRCKNLNVDLVLYQQPIQRMNLPRRYGLVFIPASSFSLIADPKDAQAALQRICHVMTHRATFVVEVETLNARPNQKNQEGRKEVRRADGKTIRLNWLASHAAEYDILHFTNRYELWDNGVLLKVEHEELPLRLYQRSTFHEMLRSAGFEHILAWEPYRRNEPDEAAASIVFECRKP